MPLAYSGTAMGRPLPRLYYGIVELLRSFHHPSSGRPVFERSSFGHVASIILRFRHGKAIHGHRRQNPRHASELGLRQGPPLCELFLAGIVQVQWNVLDLVASIILRGIGLQSLNQSHRIRRMEEEISLQEKNITMKIM